MGEESTRGQAHLVEGRRESYERLIDILLAEGGVIGLPADVGEVVVGGHVRRPQVP